MKSFSLIAISLEIRELSLKNVFEIWINRLKVFANSFSYCNGNTCVTQSSEIKNKG